MLDSEIWDNNKQFEYLFECARKKGLMTAVAIAEASEVDSNTISRLKTGRQKSPDLIQVVRLYKACGASLDRGFDMELDPVENPVNDELAAEVEELRKENELLKAAVEAKDLLLEERDASVKSARSVVNQRTKLITIQSIIITILVIAIVGVMIYDKLNLDIGWIRDTMSHITGGLQAGLTDISRML